MRTNSCRSLIVRYVKMIPRDYISWEMNLQGDASKLVSVCAGGARNRHFEIIIWIVNHCRNSHLLKVSLSRKPPNLWICQIREGRAKRIRASAFSEKHRISAEKDLRFYRNHRRQIDMTGLKWWDTNEADAEMLWEKKSLAYNELVVNSADKWPFPIQVFIWSHKVCS